MYSPFNNLSVEIFGESHSDEIGVRIKGLPRGAVVDAARVQAFVDERRSGANPWSTPRKESDVVIFKDGLQNGTVTGDVLAVIKNENARSSDYSPYLFTPRPSHADYVSAIKDGLRAARVGGGRFSGRMTAPLCIAGGIATQLLEKLGITIAAYVSEIGKVKGKSYTDGAVTLLEIENAKKRGSFSLTNADEMTEAIIVARNSGDSVGGAIECVAFGCPVGLGDALFGGLESRIAASVFAVPAVKSVEFGLGTGFADKKGSETNDAFCYRNEKVETVTNNNGGINGGISNGMPLTLRVCVKPTPSISLPQKTVNLVTKEETTIEIKGRHDACIVPRAVAAIKAAVSLALLDVALEQNLI